MNSKDDWRGFNDTTPASSTKYGPADEPEVPFAKSIDWKGMNDATPSSMPKDPDEE